MNATALLRRRLRAALLGCLMLLPAAYAPSALAAEATPPAASAASSKGAPAKSSASAAGQNKTATPTKKKAKSKAKPVKKKSSGKPKSKAKSSTKAASKSTTSKSTTSKSSSKKKTTSKKSGSLKKPVHKKRSRKSRRGGYEPPSAGMKLGLRNTPDDLALRSSSALVVDQDTGETVAFKNPDAVLPIASLTKLMTALVVTESGQPLDEMLEISRADVDTKKYTHSRLTVGTRLTRDQLLLLALMSSENRAAMALGRNYPGGLQAFVDRMNHRARELGMNATHFDEPAGLSMKSVSTARDLHRLLTAAYEKPLIRSYSTQNEGSVRVGRQTLTFVNSNNLVRNSSGDWDIGLQKTGFTNEAGRCLVMQANVLGRRLVMVFLDSAGKLTRYGDAARVRRSLESRPAKTAPVQAGIPAS